MPIPFAHDWTETTRRSARIGVIDIGSNSIRLVVYDRNCRLPVPIFNEKVLCGLGRGLETSGNLSAEGVALALTNLARFRTLATAMGIEHVEVLATAALRDARDGPDFVARLGALGLNVRVISGEEEARLSALGVLSGTPDADGVAADMGGGSMEVIAIDRGNLGQRASLPVGPLRLIEASGDRTPVAARIIEQHLSKQSWLKTYRKRRLYVVGGSWRALAKLHMARNNYPLRVIHHYTIPALQAANFCAGVAAQAASYDKEAPISRRRVDSLPYAALALEGLIRTMEPASVVFSAYGLREGHLFDLLPTEEQRLDPLIRAAADLAAHQGRFGAGEILTAWTDGLFAGEDLPALRLRRVACLLSDLSWAEHPDYRSEHAFERVLRLPVVGLTHGERAVLAVTSLIRYGGRADHDILRPLRQHLLTEAQIARAEVLGLALRFAHSLTGGVTGLLNRIGLRLSPERLDLLLPADLAGLRGEVTDRRLEALAKALNRDWGIQHT